MSSLLSSLKRELLLSHDPSSSYHPPLNVLKKLLSLPPSAVTISTLSSTQIGKTVGQLKGEEARKKYGDETADVAKSIVKKWKKSAKTEAACGSKGAAGEGPGGGRGVGVVAEGGVGKVGSGSAERSESTNPKDAPGTQKPTKADDEDVRSTAEAQVRFGGRRGFGFGGGGLQVLVKKLTFII